MEAIAHEINAYDMVALQEVWCALSICNFTIITCTIKFSALFIDNYIV